MKKGLHKKTFFGTEGQTDFNISGLCKEPHY